MPVHKGAAHKGKKAMPKGMGPGMHKMPGGMMMSDKEHTAMMGGKAPAKKTAPKRGKK